MTSLHTVAIVGVTGSQGESVARALIGTKAYRVRGLARNPSSAVATELGALGVEIVKADLNEGVANIAEAFKGAWAVYAYTALGTREAQHGKTMVDAAVKAGVERFIWLSGLDGKAISNGKWEIATFERKLEVQRYLASTSLRATIVHFGNFLENTTKFGWLSAGADRQSLVINAPIYPDDVPSPWTSVKHDVGETVRVILEDAVKNDGIHVDGKEFVGVRGRMDFEGLRAIIEEVSGLPTTYRTLSRKQILSFGPDLEPLCDLMQFLVEYPLLDNPVPDPALLELGAHFGTIKDWAEEELPQLVQSLISPHQK